ncbi:MAG: SufD family Fe-S cluster assembly protein [Bacilli bacterium]
MRQLKLVLNEALQLVNEDEYFILFNDGKAVRTNLPESVDILVDEALDSSEYYSRDRSEIETEIDSKVKFSNTIVINADIQLKILHINDEEEYLNSNVIIKKNVNATISNVYYHVINDIKNKIEIVVEDNAKLTLKSITNCYGKFTNIINGYLLENSLIVIDDIGLNDKEVDTLANIYILEENAKADLTNVVINSTSLVQKYKYIITHIKGNTESTTKNYGISRNSSYLTFDNFGVIKKGASKTNLSQKTKGIILDMYSSVSANPLLEIDENDVIANHGASIGAIDEEELYYLMSRGLSREISEGLIVQAFVTPYFENLKDEKLIDYVNIEISKHL